MATTPDFKYAPMFQMGKDTTEYRLLTTEGVSTGEFEGKTILKVSKEALTLLSQQAFHDVEFMLRREHNLQVAQILSDPEASENDKYVALQFLRNAETAAKGILPFCQDTGTAIIHGEKGQRVWTDFEDEEALSRGVYNTFTEDNLRYSQNAPLNMYDEVNTRCNLPAQIDIEAVEGDEYRFVMVAKGGGSANKTYFYPMTNRPFAPIAGNSMCRLRSPHCGSPPLPEQNIPTITRFVFTTLPSPPIARSKAPPSFSTSDCCGTVKQGL